MEEFAAKSLLGKLGSSAIKELYLAWGLKAELASLEEKLLAINAVLMDAEKKQSRNEKIRFWLQMLREFMYDAEDALDGFECEDLRRQVVKTTGSTSRKLSRFFSSSNKLALRFKMGHKIKDLNDRLAEIESLKSLLGLTEQTNRDKECTINLLVEPLKVDDAHPFVIPIVGMAGLGKTALAKSVYDDGSVDAFFELKMQACVSDGFALKQVMQKMINSATGERCNDLEEVELKAKLEMPILSKGALGSKIIVTTRSKRVAQIMGSAGAQELSLLDQKDCLTLFYKCAFKERQKEQHPNLVEIGKEIVGKCKQIPLAFWMAQGLVHQSTHPSENLEDVGIRYVPLPKFPNKIERVRTLVFVASLEEPSCRTDFEKCLSGFKHLRSLELMDVCEFLPDKIGSLKELRYLNLVENTKLKRFPKSIFKLQNLQALILGDGFVELPKDVRCLISLRLLFLITKQKRLPEGGVGCLGSLQILLIAGCENPEYLCEDMQGLKSLRKLCIGGCKNLISLPRSMKYLTALEYLSIMFLQGSAGSLQTFAIEDCPNIIELPECTGNLKELQKLVIRMCPSLGERCQRETGEDWPKIAHVPHIDVDYIFYNSELLAVIGLKLDVSVLFRSSSLDFLSCLFVAGYLVTFLQLLC
ncbi:putative disease resistance protein RGA3 [Populus trichocarpa]|uniref:putative disease resistance protein RGA3 n=1 Tax=Populus trichocarpa TaxID=3694 RepID=UPI002279A3B4|nr:putative disease resistance protein RGA3 [Populus trichocarpa]